MLSLLLFPCHSNIMKINLKVKKERNYAQFLSHFGFNDLDILRPSIFFFKSTIRRGREEACILYHWFTPDKLAANRGATS